MKDKKTYAINRQYSFIFLNSLLKHNSPFKRRLLGSWVHFITNFVVFSSSKVERVAVNY